MNQPFDFSPFSAILLDMDGTLYHEEEILPGAAALVHRLQRENRAFACITNSTTTPQRLARRLSGMGIELDAAHIYTAAEAAAEEALARYAPRPRIFNLSTEGIAELLDQRVDWAEGKSDPCDAVIAGVPTNPFATPDRQHIALHLLRQGAALIGICADRVYPSPRGIEFGSGAFCAMLGHAAGVEPTFCGKPQESFFSRIGQRLHVPLQGCLLIGDNLESDMAGARRLGMKTMLTLTGITRRHEAHAAPPEQQADWVVNDLTEIL